ncbi:MAG: VapE family protein [Ekhidna sp.]|uniref:VapE domain-containing protein n=1 Tax=Ekhidna sp. TaxID=2608089 RepID=UPI0032F0774E
MLEHEEIQKGDKPSKKHTILEVKDYLDLQYEFRRNELTLELEYRSLEEELFKVLDEAMINSIWIDLQIDGFKISDTLLIKILNSKLVGSHHPLKQYFKTLPKYDGKDHIQQLADSVVVSEDGVEDIKVSDLWKPYLEKWLVGSVATAINRGTNHLCLILAGGQGIGKTTWLNKLCPKGMGEFLVCSHINPSLTDTTTANYLAEKWFMNIDDQLETIFGKDFNAMKAIITASDVTNRKTWHRFTRKRPRICSFMGSVNNTQFLTDTENRRYLVFQVQDIVLDAKVNIDMVWSQALHLLNQKYPYWFNREEMDVLNKVNNLYRQTTPEEEWLVRLFEPCEPTDQRASYLMPSEILTQMNAFSGMKLSIKKLAMAMDRMGFGKKISKRINGQPRNVYPLFKRTEMDEQRLQDEIRNSL